MTKRAVAPRRATTNGAPGNPTPCISAAVRRAGRHLLNQQMWLFGQDIRRPEGNALIEYGFARTKPPEGSKASSTYTISVADGTTIYLWGFGLYFARPTLGGIFVPRFEFTPRLDPCDALPDLRCADEQLRDCRAPRGATQWGTTRQIFIPALRWIADYERWIVARRGLAYRAACLAPWPHAPLAAPAIQEAWDGLIADCDAGMADYLAARANLLTV